jgi:hypothetical protein
VKEGYKIKHPHQVDAYISAQIPNKEDDPEVYKIVTESMLHGPCGVLKPSSPCMKEGGCSKRFPKKFEHKTRFDNEGYIYYRRPEKGEVFVKNGIPMDNGFVVPYNRDLCKVFNAHINVEYCGWSMLIKYLFKYISKGSARVKYKVTQKKESTGSKEVCQIEYVDEIQNYIDGRYLCPHEAAWRIFDLPIHHRNPAVQLLAVHLEGKQNITFKDKSKLHQLISNQFIKKTTLTEWLLTNACDPSGRHLTYLDFLLEFWWEATGKRWIRRLSNKKTSIGRLIYIHPTCGETFYLRMLLCCQKGCTSFDDIRTVGTVVHDTYRNACDALGLLGSDIEWHGALSEASAWASASELRSLFTYLLLFCDLSNPLELWNQNWKLLGEDVLFQIRQSDSSDDIVISDSMVKQQILFRLELLMNKSTGSPSLADYGLPMPCHSDLVTLQNRLLMEERCYDRSLLAEKTSDLQPRLNNEQLDIFNLVTSSVISNKQCLLFVYGHGGTGKTYLWTTIIYHLRSMGKIVLAVAASGIASLLLPCGRTTHSRFKIPIAITDQSMCHIKKKTLLAQLLAETNLIVWDEAPMSDRRCLESLDRTLRDVLDTREKPFGGKSVVLGGDFRQTLPIRPRSLKNVILSSCLPRSYLWPFFTVRTLNENMRLSAPGITPTRRDVITHFSSWLMSVGDGTAGTLENNNSTDNRRIQIPSEYLIMDDPYTIKSTYKFHL